MSFNNPLLTDNYILKLFNLYITYFKFIFYKIVQFIHKHILLRYSIECQSEGMLFVMSNSFTELVIIYIYIYIYIYHNNNIKVISTVGLMLCFVEMMILGVEIIRII